MPKVVLAAALLLQIAVASSPQDKKGPKNEEVRKKYAALMEKIGAENKAIQKDIAEKKGDGAIKARLMAMAKNAEAASKLDYLKGSEEDVQQFKALFEIFLGSRMRSFLEETWDEKSSGKLYERLQFNCRTCHELFREE
jgi:cytochrome c556